MHGDCRACPGSRASAFLYDGTRSLTLAAGAGKVSRLRPHAAAPVRRAPGLPLREPSRPAHVAAEYLVEVVKVAVLGQVESKLDDLRPDNAHEKDADHALDRKSLERLYGVSQAKIVELQNRWSQYPEESSAKAALIADSKQLVENAMCGLYVAWDGAIGAPWFKGDLPDEFAALGGQLSTLRDLLAEQEPSATAIAEALGIAQARLTATTTQLDHDLPLKRLDELRAAIDGQAQRITDLEGQVAAGKAKTQKLNSELKRARLALTARRQWRVSVVDGTLTRSPPDPIKIAFAETQIEELAEQLKTSQGDEIGLADTLELARQQLSELQSKETELHELLDGPDDPRNPDGPSSAPAK
jgi:hypothetical protein